MKLSKERKLNQISKQQHNKVPFLLLSPIINLKKKPQIFKNQNQNPENPLCL